jgi:hypothetical protein
VIRLAASRILLGGLLTTTTTTQTVSMWKSTPAGCYAAVSMSSESRRAAMSRPDAARAADTESESRLAAGPKAVVSSFRRGRDASQCRTALLPGQHEI